MKMLSMGDFRWKIAETEKGNEYICVLKENYKMQNCFDCLQSPLECHLSLNNN